MAGRPSFHFSRRMEWEKLAFALQRVTGSCCCSVTLIYFYHNGYLHTVTCCMGTFYNLKKAPRA